MKAKVNGQEELLPENISLLDFLNTKNINLEAVVVEYNFEIIAKDQWQQITLKEGDTLEVLHFVGGG